jgi:hypothetical protein
VALIPSVGSAQDYARHRAKALDRVEISKTGGLGRIAIHGDLAAVLQRDDGVVALVDISDPGDLRVVGRYDDGATGSLDGDLSFSDDGKYLFYARQTDQFSKDGVHVLDVSDPSNPALAFYQPGGGTLRVLYYADATGEWVFALDAIEGFVVNRFQREAGALVPVHVDALPALKVGGPQSGGLFVEPGKSPLLYVTTGATGLQIFDISNPISPAEVGSWADQGLAEIEVAEVGPFHFAFAATEHWFDKGNPQSVIGLDVSDPAKIKEVERWSLDAAGKGDHRIQGMTLTPRGLAIAHSTDGVVLLGPETQTQIPLNGSLNKEAGVEFGGFAYDVAFTHDGLLVSDAGAGTLSFFKVR